MKINFKLLKPKSTKTKSLVVFMHGYGADGADLLSIGKVLADHMPDTLFVAPDAPTRCQVSNLGFQWFPIPNMDGSSERVAMEELDKISGFVHHWIDGLISQEGLNHEKVFLFGFSQGTMLSLYMGLQRIKVLGGIVGFSGKLINLDVLKKRILTRPPILLIHGDEDQVVSPNCLVEAFDELVKLNFNVKKHLSLGVGHGIAPDGLKKALDFLVKKTS